MLKYFFISLALVILLVLSAAQYRGHKFGQPPIELFPDMDHQAKYRFQKPSLFFEDGAAARVPVAGTVPMGFVVPEKAAADGGFAKYGFGHGADYYNSGSYGDFFGDGMPNEVKVSEAFLERGQERFNIYCSVCHGESGNGMGAVSNYWPTPITSLHDPRLRDRTQSPDGAIYHTITNGKGLMGAYGGNITVADRWAIVAYVRVLQQSQWSDDTTEVRGLMNAIAP